jgi:DUF4097 and DUF4098 domain-containing protein YvlB
MALGLILGILGYFCGGAKTVNIDRNGLHISNGELHTLKDLNLESFESINLDTQSFQVEFMQSEHYGIEINYYNTCNPTYSVENGTLKASDGEKNSFFSLNFGILWHRNTLKVYLPKNVSLKDITIKNASGNIDIGNFSAQSTNVQLFSGNLTMHNASSNTLIAALSSGNAVLENINQAQAESESVKLESKSGWISIQNLSTKNFSVSATSGNIDLKKLTAATFSSNCLSGNTTVQNSNLGNADFGSRSGNITAEDIATDGLTAKCSSGSINLTGALKGKTNLDASSGNVNFATSIPEDQYSYGLSASSGSVLVNGDGGASHTKLNSSAANELVINTRSGNIHADFQK